MSIGKAKVSEWLSRTVKEEKDRRNKRIFDLWLACHTQEEIGAEVKLARSQVEAICDSFDGLVSENQNVKTLSSHAEPGFKPPIYNVWKWQQRTEGSKHPDPGSLRQAGGAVEGDTTATYREI